ncbi:hypothetical protein B0A50_01812 [Salinomyces thailandicus]|uniref:Uncharacterized protein n=1 Tax=Salinomyces thailandicus TaxID=706561 RepID=A0A4U0U9D5_9PEZI|nr:hypothetical protein B0A50_01812 [Salinomyces thailandica]
MSADWRVKWLTRAWACPNLTPTIECTMIFAALTLALSFTFYNCTRRSPVGQKASTTLNELADSKIAFQAGRFDRLITPDKARAAMLHTLSKNIWQIAFLLVVMATIVGAVNDSTALCCSKGDEDAQHCFEDSVANLATSAILLVTALSAAVLVVPYLQLLLFAWTLSRYAKTHRLCTLKAYLPTMRIWSNFIALCWSVGLLTSTMYWTTDFGYLICFVLKGAMFSSALMWLKLGFAFAWRTADLTDNLERLYLGSNERVATVMRMFGHAARSTVPWKERVRGEVLPRYLDISPKRDLVRTDLAYELITQSTKKN